VGGSSARGARLIKVARINAPPHPAGHPAKNLPARFAIDLAGSSREPPAKPTVRLLPYVRLHGFVDLRFHGVEVEARALLRGREVGGGHRRLRHFLLGEEAAPQRRTYRSRGDPSERVERRVVFGDNYFFHPTTIHSGPVTFRCHGQFHRTSSLPFRTIKPALSGWLEVAPPGRFRPVQETRTARRA